MPSDRSRQALRDIVENAGLALEFTAGLDAVGFAGDRRTVYVHHSLPDLIAAMNEELGAVPERPAEA